MMKPGEWEATNTLRAYILLHEGSCTLEEFFEMMDQIYLPMLEAYTGDD